LTPATGPPSLDEQFAPAAQRHLRAECVERRAPATLIDEFVAFVTASAG
jgi:hypothetical protein